MYDSATCKRGQPVAGLGLNLSVESSGWRSTGLCVRALGSVASAVPKSRIQGPPSPIPFTSASILRAARRNRRLFRLLCVSSSRPRQQGIASSLLRPRLDAAWCSDEEQTPCRGFGSRQDAVGRGQSRGRCATRPYGRRYSRRARRCRLCRLVARRPSDSGSRQFAGRTISGCSIRRPNGPCGKGSATDKKRGP
jgi:hypothetical protein